MGTEVHVPADFPTIQQAMDHTAPGGSVIIADGTYQGTGNRDLDFKGRSFTVRSENGSDNCTIDCQGTSTDPHRAFIFHNEETTASLVDGLTIINGYAPVEHLGSDYARRP